MHLASGSLNVSRAGLGLHKVADLFPGFSWDEAGDDQHGPVRTQGTPAKHCAHFFPAVVEGGGMDMAPMSFAKGLWSREPVDEDLAFFVSCCVGACLTLAVCL